MVAMFNKLSRKAGDKMKNKCKTYNQIKGESNLHPHRYAAKSEADLALCEMDYSQLLRHHSLVKKMMDFLKENDARFLDDNYAKFLEQLEQNEGVSHVE
tara:strand:- start:2982 stop:3278 length:297 start_codon:yes stop_codon:yes gene_type:complete